MKTSCEYDNVDDRITDATGYKERGTVYFKASKYSLALKLYKRGLGIVEKSSFTKKEEKEATKGVRILLLLNMAACYLKLEKCDEANQQCEKVCVYTKMCKIHMYFVSRRLIHLFEGTEQYYHLQSMSLMCSCKSVPLGLLFSDHTNVVVCTCVCSSYLYVYNYIYIVCFNMAF